MIRILYTLLCLIFAFNLCAQMLKLTPFIPEQNPTGTAIIVCPGGSYFWLDKNTEGYEVARWLNANGIAAFVLEYHHAGWAAFAYHMRTSGRKFPAGFNDLRNAIQYVKEHATLYGIKPNRIGGMGFSAGGHLVMHAAEQLAGTPQEMSFAVLGYPVISMTHPSTHKRSRRGLLGERPSQLLKDSLSLEHHVPKNCPPIFLLNCKDDPIVDAYNSVLLDSALTAQSIPHHYEQYTTGGHGFGVSANKTSAEAIQWKERFLIWLGELFKSDLKHE